MGLKKGQCNNLKGRPKNSVNKNKALVTAFLNYVIDNGFDKFNKEINKLSGKEYIRVFLSIAKIMSHDRSNLVANEKLIELFNNKIKQNGNNK